MRTETRIAVVGIVLAALGASLTTGCAGQSADGATPPAAPGAETQSIGSPNQGADAPRQSRIDVDGALRAKEERARIRAAKQKH